MCALGRDNYQGKCCTMNMDCERERYTKYEALNP
jgi:hypothetical protein